MTKTIVSLLPMVVAIFVMLQPASAAEWRGEWETTLQKAKAEGKIVLAIPPSAELRKELEPLLKQKFGIDAELLVSRGADSANRISSEYNAGVRTIDGLIQGTTTAMSLPLSLPLWVLALWVLALRRSILGMRLHGSLRLRGRGRV